MKIEKGMFSLLTINYYHAIDYNSIKNELFFAGNSKLSFVNL